MKQQYVRKMLAMSCLLISAAIILGYFYGLASSSFLMAISFQGLQKLKGFSYTIWILTAVTTSLYFPQYFLGIGDFSFKILIVPLLQMIMFGVGSTMSVNDFMGVVKMPKGVLVGVACQFTIMPLVGYSLAKGFGFPPEIAAGLILVGSVPCGLASNCYVIFSKC